MEVVKLLQVYFISNDLQLYHAETDNPVLCRALNINEDLGQIKYVFSDKTGTLTENKMVFKRCTIEGRNFSHGDVWDGFGKLAKYKVRPVQAGAYQMEPLSLIQALGIHPFQRRFINRAVPLGGFVC